MKKLFIDYTTVDFEDFTNELWNYDWFYIYLGFILIPFLVAFLYYKLVDPTLPKVWHWLVALGISVIAVCIFGWFNLFGYFEDCIINGSNSTLCNKGFGPDEEENIVSSIYETSFFIGLYSIVPFGIASFFMRYLSINNKRNPF